MIYCSKCGSAFNEELGSCPACNTEVNGASIPEELRKKIAELTAPLPDPAKHASDDVHAAPASPTSKSRRPSDSHVPRADKTAVSDSASHEEMMSLLRSFGKKIVSTQRLAKRHGKWVWGGIVTIIVLLLGVLAPDWWQRWQHPQPDAIWIEVQNNVTQWPEGKPLRLTARTEPPDNIPREFRWRPASMIEGHGQSVVLNTSTSDYHTEPYPVNVGLIAVDQLGNTCRAVKEVTITIVPMARWNNPPDLKEWISMEGSPVVKSGTSAILQALATDIDGDKLTYNWSVVSKLVDIAGNGERRVVLKFPRDFARGANVNLTVKLTVTDGFKSTLDHVDLTITPAGSVRISRPSRKRVPPKAVAPEPQLSPAPPPKIESSPSAAVPHSVLK